MSRIAASDEIQNLTDAEHCNINSLVHYESVILPRSAGDEGAHVVARQLRYAILLAGSVPLPSATVTVHG